ncbi:hypothetical protein FBY41_3224 [Humibacillus xanthopallidus]|uniref:Uncharacterized protein n=1 Tax=Humibacillus xanthopallidus TaxID=412689 RepID=A0A543HHS8_9MICO|nr:hypothetical protein FBY41_3224 [Humibacillus xanthopallidus]
MTEGFALALGWLMFAALLAVLGYVLLRGRS